MLCPRYKNEAGWGVRANNLQHFYNWTSALIFSASLVRNFIQMMTSLWKFALLLLSFTGANGLDPFPENFVVAKQNGKVRLTCGTDIDGEVTWNFDEAEIEDFKDNIQRDGQNLLLTEVDDPILGKYSCWRGEEMLSSTHLFLEAEEELDITCWAKSYHCKFSCIWKESERVKAVRLGLGHDCAKGGKSCRWVSSSGQNLAGGFQFELSHSLSPYAEETTMLELTTEAIIGLSVSRMTKRFYLRDIVQPDSPQIGSCQKQEESLKVTIAPPASWPTPHSFFCLEHQIEYIFKDDGTTGHSISSLIPVNISKLRVRSRDPLVQSTWSEWSAWKNVRTREEDLCKCRNRVKYCCPELPPALMDRCKKRRKKKNQKHS